VLDDGEDAQSFGSRGCEEIFKVIICCLPEVEQKMVVSPPNQQHASA